MREPAGQELAHQAKELPIRRDSRRRLRYRQGDQLGIRDLAFRAGARDGRSVGEDVRCDNKGLQRCCHLVLQSLEGPFFVYQARPCS